MKHTVGLFLALAVIALTATLSLPVASAPDGNSWSTMSSGTTNDLRGVWGSSASDVFAVGEGGTILHYDGSTWNSMTSGVTWRLRDVWGSSASDVFAVGGILHYDGSNWSVMPGAPVITLYAVWGSSASDVFAVGPSGTILHYDGSTWSVMSSGTGIDLWDVWGSSASDVFAAGFSDTILHYDGSTWSAISSGTGLDVMGLWGSSASDLFAVGSSSTILHYDGSTWSSMSSGTTYHLKDVWGSSASDVFAVGHGGTILHYDGSTWSIMSSGTTNVLNSVWGNSSSDVFAVGDSGTILHYVPLITALEATVDFDPDSLNLRSGGKVNTSEISIEAYIDGRSLLIITENTVQWHHLDWAAPGRHGFVNLPTVINGMEWYPEWPDWPDEENRTECFSSVYEGLAPPLPESDMEVELRIVQARNSLSIAQYPSGDNDYALILDFNDNPVGGPAWYECELIVTSQTTASIHSKARVTVYIELPEGYDVNDIDVSTILLNDTVSAELRPVTVGDHNGNGIPDLMVKFDRSDVQDVLEPGDEVEVTVSGELTDSTPFEGTDTIRVIEKGKK